MLTISMVVTIWMGATKSTFRLYPTGRFNWDTQCTNRADDIVDQIRRHARSIKKMTRIDIESTCSVSATRPA